MSEEPTVFPKMLPHPMVPDGVVMLLNNPAEVRQVVEIVKENESLRAEVAALREALHDTMAALGAPRDRPSCGYAQVAIKALAAERERVIEECCRAICGRCFAGAPIVGTANGKPLHEYSCGKEGCTRHRGATQECCAHAIRALTPAPGAAGTPTEGT